MRTKKEWTNIQAFKVKKIFIWKLSEIVALMSLQLPHVSFLNLISYNIAKDARLTCKANFSREFRTVNDCVNHALPERTRNKIVRVLKTYGNRTRN